MEHTGKVFGIGLSRTGTTTLADALQKLGYKTVHVQRPSQIDAFEASTDTPVSARYRLLDKRYPNSKFILTTRDIESWLASCEKWWYDLSTIKDKEIALEFAFCRGALYGVDYFDREIYREAYHRHVNGVREYFRDRPNDLLEINITAGDGFEKICPFLGKPLLNEPLPKLNQAQSADNRAIELYEQAAQYYHEAQNELAKEALHSAILLDMNRWTNQDWVLEWLAAEARTGELNSPEAFINRVFENLPAEATNLAKYRQKAITRYHISAAFDAYAHHDKRGIRRHILPAILHSPFLVANRGFIKICLLSLLGIATISQSL